MLFPAGAFLRTVHQVATFQSVAGSKQDLHMKGPAMAGGRDVLKYRTTGLCTTIMVYNGHFLGTGTRPLVFAAAFWVGAVRVREALSDCNRLLLSTAGASIITKNGVPYSEYVALALVSDASSIPHKNVENCRRPIYLP